MMRNILMGALVFLVTVSSYGIEIEQLTITSDVVYGHKHGMALTYDVFQPKQDANGAGVLFMVSGGMYSKWVPPHVALGYIGFFLDEGYTVFTIRHGSSPKYVTPEITEDVLRSVRSVRLQAARFGVDPERLGVIGMSSGGYLSLVIGTMADDGDPAAEDELLKTSNRVAAVVAFFPPTDLREWVKEGHPMNKQFPALDFEEALAPGCSPLLQVTDDDAPTLMIHGDQDQLVPLEHSQNIEKEFKKNGVSSKLVIMEGAGHGFRDEQNDQAKKETLQWFARYLNVK